VAQTSGPASNMPTMIRGHRPSGDTPEATTPHENAHIGGNQVIGFSSSVTLEKEGRDRTAAIGQVCI
jgi:hypothetical protein